MSAQLSDYLIRHAFLDYSPEGWAREKYIGGEITSEEFEQILDAAILGKGVEAAVRCPRCGNFVYGIGTADGSMIAVRCRTPDCHFVGYAEP